MSNTSVADLISGVPGTYIISSDAYDRAEDFSVDAAWLEKLCSERGHAFRRTQAGPDGLVAALRVEIQAPM